MKVLILEDEDIQREALKSMVKGVAHDIEVYSSGYVKEGIEIAKKENIDLFILDVKLLDGTGLDFAIEIRKWEKYELTYVIFISTYDQFQLEAFKKVHSHDYITKPYTRKKVEEEIYKIYRWVNRDRESIQRSIYVDQGNSKAIILLDDIYFIKSERKNVIIYTKKDSYLVKRVTVGEMLHKINSEYFIQSHRSYIINVKNMANISEKSKNSWEVIFDGTELKASVGKTYKNKFEFEIAKLQK